MTKEQIQALIMSSDRAVERAVVALYQRQTQDEQRSSSTQHQNGRGFNAFDASKGSYWAKWVLDNRRLTGRHLHGARQLVLRYLRQLCEISSSRPSRLAPPIPILQRSADSFAVLEYKVQGPQGMNNALLRLDPFLPFPGVSLL